MPNSNPLSEPIVIKNELATHELHFQHRQRLGLAAKPPWCILLGTICSHFSRWLLEKKSLEYVVIHRTLKIKRQ